MATYPLLVDILVLIAISIPVSFLFHRLGLPPVAGFLATGVIAGPYGTGLISEIEAVRLMAEIGVVLLLFTIGLEFSVRHLLSIGRRGSLAALSQVVITVAVTALVATLFHLPVTQAVFLGFLFSLSSTAIVLKILSDRGEIDTPHGRITIAILLFQDLCAIPMMMISPGLAEHKVNLLHTTRQLAVAVMTVIALYITARYLVPLLLRQVVRIRNRELFLFTILFTCLGTAYVSATMGLSLALGAFIAGLVISESTYSHQILSDILPFRDIFNAMFFISIGMLLNLSLFLENLQWNLTITAAVFFGKIMLVLLILLLFKSTFRISLITAFSLAQVGEFSFLLAEEGMKHQILPEPLYQGFLASSVLTMFLTPFAMMV
ncbi:MAG TPA: cation:proton antiporter, partial [Acidobacteriota bacterium]